MKHLLFLTLISMFSFSALAGIGCKDIEQRYGYWGLREMEIAKGSVLTVDNWKNFDVVASFESRQCVEYISQSLLQIEGELFWMFYSTNDICDGGNTYGSIYTFDLSEVVAHIYDQDIGCQDDWREEERSKNHQCDLPAMSFAEGKMKNLGFDFVAEGALMDLQKGFDFSGGRYVFVSVSGEITNRDNTQATVKVRGFIPTDGGCDLKSASLDYIPL